jgi:hypothetical protein
MKASFFLVRLPVAVALLLGGGVVSYGVGAGYFPPIAIPSPLNVVATIGLAVALILTIFRAIIFPGLP